MLGYGLEDSAFERRWDTDKNWSRFEAPVQRALESLMADTKRREAFATLGLPSVLLSLELQPASRKPGLRVSRVGDLLDVTIRIHFGFKAPTEEEIHEWALGAFTEALDTGLKRAAKKK